MSLDLAIRVERPGFTLAVELATPGTALGIFGPSGAGKTTLLHALAGLVRPRRGRIVVDGRVLFDASAGIDVPCERRRIGVVFQHGRLFPHLRVAANLRYGFDLVPVAERTIAVATVVELLGLGQLLDRHPAHLSGGERQRVALGRALLAQPRLLLLDEPVAALDRGLRRQVLPYLRRVRAALGIPCLHVSHDLEELLGATDHLALLQAGRVAGHGTIGELARRPALLPLLHDLGLLTALPARIAHHVPADGLTYLRLTEAVTIAVPLRGEAPGTAVEALLRPADIALAPAPLAGISLQNQLPGRVVAITGSPERTVVTVDAGVELLVEVSAKTVRDLGLAPGSAVCCLFKAQAVRVREL